MISGTEWIVIVILIIALLIFGPSKIPELARALGRARREYEKAARGEEAGEDEEKIIALARELGIDTKGKSMDEILDEIKKVAGKSRKGT
ncbi:MAG: twin-arginine translocase TatA/TatE family subunit [Desulfurococcaceae archaeon]